MNRITSFLALSAIVVAGAFAGTAAQASAANVNVDFKVHNADASASMIRSGAPSSDDQRADQSGGGDLARRRRSGERVRAVLRCRAPAVGGSVSGSGSYANASDGVSNLCTFTITVTRTGAERRTSAFLSRRRTARRAACRPTCTNSDGQFTSTTYALDLEHVTSINALGPAVRLPARASPDVVSTCMAGRVVALA